jgi:hypothetical protein
MKGFVMALQQTKTTSPLGRATIRVRASEGHRMMFLGGASYYSGRQKKSTVNFQIIHAGGRRMEHRSDM